MSSRNEGAFVVALRMTDKMKTENPPLQVLLQKRLNTGLHDGNFAFPGGKRKNNETLEAAACRELREETGLIVEKYELQELWKYKGRDPHGGKWLAIFYLCIIDSGCGRAKYDLKEPNKHEIVQWLPLDELPMKKVPRTVSDVFSILKNPQFLESLKDPHFLESLKDPHNPKARKIIDAGLRNAISDIKKKVTSREPGK